MDPETDNASQPDYESDEDDYFYNVEQNLRDLVDEYAEEDDLDGEQEGEYKERLIELAGDVVTIVEELQRDEPEELPTALEQAEGVLNKIINFAYHNKVNPGEESKKDGEDLEMRVLGWGRDEIGLFSMMKSFAETTERPLLQSLKKKGEFCEFP